LTRSAQRIADYELVAKLGRGGMGWVFKAIHKETGKEAAIKVLPPEMAADEKFVTRFLREAQAATVLHHKNIVRVYEAGQYQSIYYIALEYIQGETLAHALEREGTIPLKQALNIVYQVAEGLAHAHERGIIHRDIKPANIMITKDGTVKIMDMGLAKWTRSERYHDPTRPGFTVGSPAYMSPEQVLEPKTLDGRTDIYSLGSTLYHILTGRPPHLGKDAKEVMLKIVKTEVEYPPEMPEIVVRLLKKMLAKKRSERFRNAESLLRALEKVMRHFGMEVPRKPRKPSSSRIQRALPAKQGGLPRKERRKPFWPFFLFGGIFALFIVVLLFSSGSGGPTTTSPSGRQKGQKTTPHAPPEIPSTPSALRAESPRPSPDAESCRGDEKKAREASEAAVSWFRGNPNSPVEACRRFDRPRARYGTISGADVTDHINEIAARITERTETTIEQAIKLAKEGKKALPDAGCRRLWRSTIGLGDKR